MGWTPELCSLASTYCSHTGAHAAAHHNSRVITSTSIPTNLRYSNVFPRYDNCIFSFISSYINHKCIFKNTTLCSSPFFSYCQRVKDEVQKRKTQCNGSCHESSNGEPKIVKPLGHEQFLVSLGAANLISNCPDQRTTGNQKFLHNKTPTVYEEPIKSVETKP